MIVDARDHYEHLLARVYTWMAGPSDAVEAAARRLLEQLGIAAARPGQRALDLGAGPGFHAEVLSALGYDVWALDLSKPLLDELAAAVPAIHTVEADLVAAHAHVAGPFDVIVCLGDTLPHLPDDASVRAALASATSLLAPGGRIAIAFRDYTTTPAGETRHILVRGDADRLLTCRLDYRDDDVVCTDLIHERAGAGWTLQTSSYRKLRLSGAVVARELDRLGVVNLAVGPIDGWITITGTHA